MTCPERQGIVANSPTRRERPHNIGDGDNVMGIIGFKQNRSMKYEVCMRKICYRPSLYHPSPILKFGRSPNGSGYALQCQLAPRDGVGISTAIPNANTTGA
jgi:hypothetical protein